MFYVVRIGRLKHLLLPGFLVLVESDELLQAVLSCDGLDITKYVIKEVKEISLNTTVQELFKDDPNG